MKKSILCLLPILIATAFFIGCSSNPIPKDPPSASITIGGKEINPMMCVKNWGNYGITATSEIQDLAKSQDENNGIITVKLGQPVVIDFNKTPPDQLKIYDAAISDDKSQAITSEKIIQPMTHDKDGKYTFVLGKSSYAALGDPAIRGFRILADWGSSECEYSFVFRAK